MVNQVFSLFLFSLLPAVALVVGSIYSIFEIRQLADRRLVVIVLILGLMAVHQFQEVAYYLDAGAFRDPVLGELPETAVNLLSAGGVYYLLSFARTQRDLKTELAASKADAIDVKRRLEAIFENVNDWILLIDMEREAIIEANRPAHRLLRYDTGKLVGRSPYDIHPQQPEQFDRFADSIRTDGGAVTEELRCRRGDGSTMPAAVSAARTTLDETEMLLITIRDNSRREQYRTQLAVLARVLRHNLRNDMTVILGALTMAKDRIDDEALRERIDRAINKGEALIETSDKTRKLTEMLDAAHGTGTETTDIVPVVERIVDEYREMYPTANITSDCPDTALVEASENVGWAIENLVENAIIHTDESPELRLTVAAETTSEDGRDSEWVTVMVADTGPGIPESEVAVLRDETTRSSTQHGSGLGLWIAQQIARTFHGQLKITRKPESVYSTAVKLRLQPAADDSTVGGGT